MRTTVIESLRDELAGRYMQAYVTNPATDDISIQHLADLSYQMADAMLAARTWSPEDFSEPWATNDGIAPDLPKEALLRIKHRDNSLRTCTVGQVESWTSYDLPQDIVAYRIINTELPK